MVEERDWLVRQVLYQRLVVADTAPSPNDIGDELGIGIADVQDALERLESLHLLTLDPCDRSLRILNPFSGVPTDFRVIANGVSYWGNCALDALGIPAALHADAIIETRYADTDMPLRIEVTAGRVRGLDAIVHFPLPLRHWYDDRIFT